MNELQNFNFKGSQVRTVVIDDKPYFVGKDVAMVLGYKNTKDALSKHVDSEDKLGSQIATSGQRRQMTVINESGLYSLILSSKLPSAKQFKRWVTHEVLPAIRKTGSYSIQQNYPIPQTYSDALRLAAKYYDINKKNQPKVEYFDNQMHNPGLMTVTEIAKDYGWSAKRMNLYLAEKRIIYRQGKRWVLYQKYAAKGYAQYEAFPFDDNKEVHNNLKWTQRGKKFIYDLLGKDGIYPVLQQMNLLEEV